MSASGGRMQLGFYGKRFEWFCAIDDFALWMMGDTSYYHAHIYIFDLAKLA